MEGLIEKTAEKLGVGFLEVFEKAGKENPAFDVRDAWLSYLHGGKIVPAIRQFCLKVLEGREDVLSRVEE